MDMDHGTLVRPDPLDTSDVDGARPKPLPIRLRSNHPFNTNADIEYSSPHFQQTHGKFYTQRNSNTLQPSYKLPSSSFEPLPPPRSKPRDLLWTLPQNDWKPQTRDIMNWSDVEGHGRDFLFRKAAGKRDTIDARDINRPQFRCEEPSQRRTDPLRPTYVYDNGEVDHVVTHVPKYGQRYGRTPEENYNLIVKDVNGDNVHQSCYPNWLIKTRKANNTQDIPGAQVRRRLRSLPVLPTPSPTCPKPYLPQALLSFLPPPAVAHTPTLPTRVACTAPSSSPSFSPSPPPSPSLSPLTAHRSPLTSHLSPFTLTLTLTLTLTRRVRTAVGGAGAAAPGGQGVAERERGCARYLPLRAPRRRPARATLPRPARLCAHGHVRASP